MSRRGENIRKRKDGRWEGRYYTHDLRTGQSSVHSVYAKTYGEVKGKLSAAKQSVQMVLEEDSGKKKGISALEAVGKIWEDVWELLVEKVTIHSSGMR